MGPFGPSTQGVKMKQILTAVIAGAAGAILAVVALFGGTAIAGTGVGAVFNLGQTNTVDAQSVLTGSRKNGALVRVVNTGTGTGTTALNLQVPDGKQPFVTNGTGKVINLQADTVDGQSADELARAAGQSGTPSPWGGTNRMVLQTVTITAPQQGFVFLSGSVNAYYSDSGCDYCSVQLRFHDVETNTDTVTSGTVTVPGGNIYEPLALSVTLPVTAGTHTFQLVGSWLDPAEGAEPSWYDSSASALFFRFNGSGTSVASTPRPSGPEPTAPGGSSRGK